MHPTVNVAGVPIGGEEPLALIAGPDLIESEALAMQVAEFLRDMGERLGIPVIFKASFDKANRTSVSSHRGPGLEEGLRVLRGVREKTGLPVTTDVHEISQVRPASEVVDLIQVPAFLCRQTDLLVAAGASGKPVNVKRGQFTAPSDAEHIAAKVRSGGGGGVMLTERGSAFGYQNLVVDMRSIPWMRRAGGCPVVFDATHSVQLPSAASGQSGGTREFIPHLARAAVAAGADAVFMEIHPDPASALCDGAVSLTLTEVEPLVKSLQGLRASALAWNRTAAESV